MVTGWWAARAQAQTESPSVSVTYGARAAITVKPDLGAAAVDAQSARDQAGALGEPARGLSNLAGVSHAAFDAGSLTVWGSGDSEHRFYVDGVEVPTLFHPGGFRSAVPASLIARATLTPAAAPAQYGRGLGATVELDTRELVEDAQRARLAVDFFDTCLDLNGGEHGLRAFITLRRGYLDALQAWLAPETRDVLAWPGYADGAVKLSAALDNDADLSAVWVGSGDDLRVSQYSVDPLAQRERRERRETHTVYLRYRRAYGDRAQVMITPFIGHTVDALGSVAG
jgi:hypothetical protein